jgi:hypothetical protein
MLLDKYYQNNPAHIRSSKFAEEKGQVGLGPRDCDERDEIETQTPSSSTQSTLIETAA